MTLTLERPVDAFEAAAPAPEPAAPEPGEARARDLLLIAYSGDLEKIWATLLLASTGAAMGMKTRVFLTFWGLPAFVKDQRRITGQNWMQRMLAVFKRPGISHRKTSTLNFLGMGPWMMRKLAKQYGTATPAELLALAQSLDVEFIPCQMTMDMFGLKREDFIDGIGEPVGAATVLGIMNDGAAALFI